MGLFGVLSSEKIREKILEFFYEKWFTQHIGHYDDDEGIINSENHNVVKIQMRSLEGNGLIVRQGDHSLIISKLGIDEYESTHHNQQRVSERTDIITYLKTKYEENCDEFVSDSDIIQKIYGDKVPPIRYLLSQISYLEDGGKIEHRGILGKNFYIRLTNFGYESSM